MGPWGLADVKQADVKQAPTGKKCYIQYYFCTKSVWRLHVFRSQRDSDRNLVSCWSTLGHQSWCKLWASNRGTKWGKRLETVKLAKQLAEAFTGFLRSKWKRNQIDLGWKVDGPYKPWQFSMPWSIWKSLSWKAWHARCHAWTPSSCRVFPNFTHVYVSYLNLDETDDFYHPCLTGMGGFPRLVSAAPLKDSGPGWRDWQNERSKMGEKQTKIIQDLCVCQCCSNSYWIQMVTNVTKLYIRLCIEAKDEPQMEINS